jgi:hypothetical protein
MKREDAVSVLRELMGACPSFVTASSVSIMRERGEWVLSVFWVPAALEGDCVKKIVSNHGLEVSMSNGRMVFRSSARLP